MEWRKVLHGYYEISNTGLIRRIKKAKGAVIGKTLNPYKRGNNKYLAIDAKLYPHKDKSAYIHCLVAEAFLGEKPNGLEISHKNGNRYDNRVENLEYVTHSENMRLSVVHGAYEDRSDLTESKVRHLRQLKANGMRTKELAEMFNISAPSVCDIVARRTWKHVD